MLLFIVFFFLSCQEDGVFYFLKFYYLRAIFLYICMTVLIGQNSICYVFLESEKQSDQH